MSKPWAYYNEIDQFAADWLRSLIAAGHIAPGEVDTRSIADVQPEDVKGFTQAHFFAGIAGWSYALRLAGWPDDVPVWTGSCPCQPFSTAGKKRGTEDERHLWPQFARLIAECNPPTVFGEQVASKAGRTWLSGVRADLEAMGYAVGAADLCAASVGAPHIRQRLWFVGHAGGAGLEGWRVPGRERYGERAAGPAGGDADDLADAVHAGRAEGRPGAGSGQASRGGDAGRLADMPEGGRGPWWPSATSSVRSARTETSGLRDAGAVERAAREQMGIPGRTRIAGGTHWSSVDWIPCRDGKFRPVEPGTFPLAHGIPGRMGRLRAYGNAIVPQVAAEFIAAFVEATTSGDRQEPEGPTSLIDAIERSATIREAMGQ